jgi:hypothetical protein
MMYRLAKAVDLDLRVVPRHIFSVRRRLRTERDFDYYL